MIIWGTAATLIEFVNVVDTVEEAWTKIADQEGY